MRCVGSDTVGADVPIDSIAATPDGCRDVPAAPLDLLIYPDGGKPLLAQSVVPAAGATGSFATNLSAQLDAALPRQQPELTPSPLGNASTGSNGSASTRVAAPESEALLLVPPQTEAAAPAAASPPVPESTVEIAPGPAAEPAAEPAEAAAALDPIGAAHSDQAAPAVTDSAAGSSESGGSSSSIVYIAAGAGGGVALACLGETNCCHPTRP